MSPILSSVYTHLYEPHTELTQSGQGYRQFRVIYVHVVMHRVIHIEEKTHSHVCAHSLIITYNLSPPIMNQTLIMV